MNENQNCPLPKDGAFLLEYDIPHECRECLGLVFDSESGSNGYPRIKAPHKVLEAEAVGKMCEHDMYYWMTSLRMVSVSKRIIEIAATCDDCDNFVANSFEARCKNI